MTACLIRLERLLSSYFFRGPLPRLIAQSVEERFRCAYWTLVVLFWTSDYSSTDYNPPDREGVKMLVAVLTAILLFGLIVFCAWRLVKEKSAETKERAAEEMKKPTPDSNEFH